MYAETDNTKYKDIVASLKFAGVAALVVTPGALILGAPFYMGRFLVFWAIIGAYLCFLLKQKKTKTGNSVAVTTWAAMAFFSCTGFVFGPGTILLCPLAMFLVWLLRAGIKYDSLFPVIGDAIIAFGGFMASLIVLVSTHSTILCVWTFFLTQSLIVYLPRKLGSGGANTSSRYGQVSSENDRFEALMKVASDALSTVEVHGMPPAR